MSTTDAALVGSIAEIIAATATAAAVGWAAFEFHRKRVADLEQRAAEIESVTIGYRLQKPRRSEVHDGAGTYSYDFTLFNPGRLPLTEVSVSMIYPGAVRRVHGDGTVDPAQTTYEMHVAAIPTAGSFTWHRDLSVPTEVMPQMRGTRGEITFRTADAAR